jgi:putative DNA primase/helicase
VPFVTTPRVIDKELPAKHAAEYPAILAWMVEGCLAWQERGLAPPLVVQDTTKNYLEGEDTVGRWKDERTLDDASATILSTVAYADWREWCHENGEYAGSLRRFVSGLQAHKLEKWQDPVTRRNGFRGLRLAERAGIEDLI